MIEDLFIRNLLKKTGYSLDFSGMVSWNKIYNTSAKVVLHCYPLLPYEVRNFHLYWREYESWKTIALKMQYPKIVLDKYFNTIINNHYYLWVDNYELSYQQYKRLSYMLFDKYYPTEYDGHQRCFAYYYNLMDALTNRKRQPKNEYYFSPIMYE